MDTNRGISQRNPLGLTGRVQEKRRSYQKSFPLQTHFHVHLYTLTLQDASRPSRPRGYSSANTREE